MPILESLHYPTSWFLLSLESLSFGLFFLLCVSSYSELYFQALSFFQWSHAKQKQSQCLCLLWVSSYSTIVTVDSGELPAKDGGHWTYGEPRIRSDVIRYIIISRNDTFVWFYVSMPLEPEVVPVCVCLCLCASLPFSGEKEARRICLWLLTIPITARLPSSHPSSASELRPHPGAQINHKASKANTHLRIWAWWFLSITESESWNLASKSTYYINLEMCSTFSGRSVVCAESPPLTDGKQWLRQIQVRHFLGCSNLPRIISHLFRKVSPDCFIPTVRLVFRAKPALHLKVAHAC